ncbi:MAG: hypothetical protein EOO69_00435 [Moraxellaceae bacterium]|nr:MAG: hypothetical protein EOO69_00435 [Moraxellaceae bacterium]
MAARTALSQQQWVGINYGLMLLSLFLGIGVLIALWSSYHFLNQSQDLWLRAHHLWIMRSCAGLLGFLMVNSLLLVPLFWLPITQGVGYYCVLAGVGFAALVWLWFLYRSVQGLAAFIKGKSVY